MSDRDDDTGHRRLTPVENELLDDLERARQKFSIDHRIRRLENRDAELHGVDGRGGRFNSMEGDVKDHDVRITSLETLRWKLAGAVMLGGGVVAAVTFLIQLALKG